MPLKLIWYILILIFIFTFIGLNLGNTSDINLWFNEASRLKDVPIFISFFVMYILGAISVIPYIIGSGLKRQKQLKQQKKDTTLPTVSQEKKPKRKLGRKGDNSSESNSDGTEII